MPKEEKNIDNEEVKLYELAFHLIPTVEENVQKETEALKKAVSKIGNIVKDSNPALINLAYVMEKSVDSRKQKYNTALFGWIKFEASADKISELKEDVDLNKSVLRYLIITSELESDIDASDVAQMQGLGDKQIGVDTVRAESDDEVEVDEVVEETTEDKDTKSEEVDKEVDEAIDELVEEDK